MTSADRVRRVVKLGGSLLRQPDLIERLERWLEARSGDENLVIVGGGQIVEAIRELDAIRPGDQAETHWRCVRLLQTTFDIVADWFPHWRAIADGATLERCSKQGFSRDAPTLIAVSAFYRPSVAKELPEDWRTTTDAISGWLSILVSADRLDLLKSCNVHPQADLASLSERGVVDEGILTIASRLPPVTIHCLRNASLD